MYTQLVVSLRCKTQSQPADRALNYTVPENLDFTFTRRREGKKKTEKKGSTEGEVINCGAQGLLLPELLLRHLPMETTRSSILTTICNVKGLVNAALALLC